MANTYRIVQTAPEVYQCQLSTVSGWLPVSPHFYELPHAIEFIAYKRREETFTPIVYDEFGVAQT